MDKTQDIKKIISDLVDHINRRNIHDIIDVIDDKSLRDILRKMFECACGLERMK